MKEKVINRIKNHKELFGLTLFFILYCLIITKFGKTLYGSVLDWNCQHYLIPDYFRKLFYKTHNLFPAFAFNLGGGQNIFNFSYYGYASPVILLSYLFPFISMKTYIQISSILLVYFSVILFYKWIEKKFPKKLSLCLTIIFMLSAPLLFHSHRHIMFINYMPFLMMGLIGVDSYFTKGKKFPLMISVFLIATTSYFFSVGAIITLVIYGIYIYLKLNKKITIKEFIKDGFKFIYPIMVGILSSLIVLIPTLMSILNGRGKSPVTIDYLSLFIPKINLDFILYNTYSPGLISILFFSLIYIIVRLKREKRFLGIVLSVTVLFPVFMFILNGGMYINSKVLIPMLPLYILSIGLMIDSITKLKRNDILLIVGFFILSMIVCFTNEINYLFIADFIITTIVLLVFNKKKNENLLIVLVVVISLASFISASTIDELVERNYSYDKKSTTEFIEYIEDTDKSFYRVSNRNGGLGTANDVINADYYKASIYSSVSNIDYKNFYYNLIGNEIQNRSMGQLSDPKNLLYNIYMGNKYLIGEYKEEYGYDILNSIHDNYLYINDEVLPIGYSSDRLMSKKDYDKLTYPYNTEALLNYIIVDNDSSYDNYKTDIEKIAVDYSVINNKGIKTEEKDDYTEINTEGGELLLKVNSDLNGKILFIKFDLLDSNSCSVGDNTITINGVINKLTCRSWKYYNNNKTFHYTISDKNIDELKVEFSKGNYKIKNIETYTIDYSKLVSNYNNISKFNIDTSFIDKELIEGTINVLDDGYFNISIPYDKGFSIYVDDEKIDYEKTDLSFIGFKINKGNHKISIKYNPSIIEISKRLSSSGLIIILITYYIEWRPKRRK